MLILQVEAHHGYICICVLIYLNLYTYIAYIHIIFELPFLDTPHAEPRIIQTDFTN